MVTCEAGSNCSRGAKEAKCGERFTSAHLQQSAAGTRACIPMRVQKSHLMLLSILHIIPSEKSHRDFANVTLGCVSKPMSFAIALLSSLSLE